MKANAIGTVSVPLGTMRPISWPVFVAVFFLGNVPITKLVA